MSKPEPILPLYQTETNRSSKYSMQELDPSPVEETPPPYLSNNLDESDIEKHGGSGYFPPSSSSSSRSTTNSLGVRTNRIPRILLAIQKYSIVPPTAYLIMHYTNTAIIPLSTLSLPEAERYLLLTRPYYQSFPIEPVVVFIPIVSHVLSGLILRLYRRRQAAKRYGAETHAERHRITKQLWPKLSTTSLLGYLLYPMLMGHVLVQRIAPQLVHGDSSNVGLRFFHHALQKHRIITNVGYAAMVGVASFHFVAGAAKYLKLSGEYVTESGDYGARKRKTRARIIAAVSSLMAALWAAGGLGVVGRGVGGAAASSWEVKAWEEVLKGVPVVGSWL